MPDNILMLVFEKKTIHKESACQGGFYLHLVMRCHEVTFWPLFFIFTLINFYSMYEYLSACMHMHHMHAWFLWRLEEGIRSSGIGVQTIVNHHVGVGK